MSIVTACYGHPIKNIFWIESFGMSDEILLTQLNSPQLVKWFDDIRFFEPNFEVRTKFTAVLIDLPCADGDFTDPVVSLLFSSSVGHFDVFLARNLICV